MCSGKWTCNGSAIVCQPTVFFLETFGGNASNTWTKNGEWQIAPAVMGPASPMQVGVPDPADDHTNTPDKMLAGIIIGGNVNPGPHGPDYLYSPIIDASGGDKVYVSLWRWLNSETISYMFHTVAVSPDGFAWTTIFTNGAQVLDSQWKPFSYDVTLLKSATFRIRFGVEVIAGGSDPVSSWNIDDVAVSTCPPAP
jgi:hypothetical protein